MKFFRKGKYFIALLLTVVLLPAFVLAQSNLTIDFSKVAVNAQKQAAFTTQLNTIVDTLKANIGPLGTPRISTVAVLYPSGTNNACGSSGNASLTTAGCYIYASRQLVINSEVFGSTAAAKTTIAHEILHSSISLTNHSGIAAGAAYEEMLVEYFAQKSFPSSPVAYDWLVELVPGIRAVLAATGDVDPDNSLELAMFGSNLALLNDAVNPYLASGNFLADLGRFISTDPDRTRVNEAKTHLASVAREVRANFDAEKAAEEEVNNPSNNPSSPVPVASCNGDFKITDLASGNILIPPFLRTADSAQSAGFDCLSAGIAYYTQLLLVVIGLAAFFYLLYGAFLYVSAFGEESKVQQGKKAITNAVIGLILASLAGILVSLLKSILKVT